MGKPNTVQMYLNGMIGYLPRRRMILISHVDSKDERVCKIYFSRLINLEEISIEGFIESDAKRIIKRGHSKWAIIQSELIISEEALGMLGSMVGHLDDITPLNKKDD